MKAFISETNQTGEQLALGSFTNFVTGEYKTEKNLIKFSLRNRKAGYYRIEIYSNWDYCYGPPNKTRYVYHGG